MNKKKSTVNFFGARKNTGNTTSNNTNKYI